MLGKNLGQFIIFSICLIGLVAISNVYAQDIKLSLEVDKNSMTMEDVLQVEVGISGVRDLDSLPQLQNTSFFKVQQAGTGSQMQIINGHVSQKISVTYLLYPIKEGKTQIGPALLDLNGKKYQSEQVTINISKGQEQASNGTAPAAKNYFLETKVSNEHPYVGEQVVYTFKLFTKVDIRNAAITSMPDFKGFWKEELSKQKSYTTVINGINWNVNEISFALFPTHEGLVTLSAGEIQGHAYVEEGNGGGRRASRRGMNSFFADDFFSGGTGAYKPVSIRSNEIKLNVQALPQEGRPADFSGLVGHFSLESDISKTSLKVGESLSYNLTLKGDGNIRDFQLASLNLNNFKVYDDSPQVKVGGDDRLYGMKVLKKALVPTLAGTQQIIGPSVSIFNPQTKKYELIKGKDFTLNVLAGDPNTAPIITSANTNTNSSLTPSTQTLQKEIKVLGQDLMSLMGAYEYHMGKALSPLSKILIYVSFIALFILYLLIYFIKNRSDLWSKDQVSVFQQKAFSIYKANDKKIKLESAHFFADSSKNLRDFLANKFRLEGKSMSSLDVERLLSPHQIPENIIREIKNILHESEMAQYGGDQNSNSLQNRKNLKMKMEDLVKSLDKFVILFLMLLGLMLGHSSPEAFASTSIAESSFTLGNKAFNEGNYSESQKHFQKDLANMGDNAAVYYNLASAHFRQGSGHLGFALFYLRKAADIWPEHPDIKANMNYLRTLRLDQIANEKQNMAEVIFKHSLSLPLSTDALLFLILFLAIFLTFSSILALYVRANGIIKWSKTILFIFFMGSVIIYVTRLVSSSASYGVVTTTEAKIYSSTSKESILLFTLHEAAEFKVKDFSEDKNWVQIQLADNKKGWLEKRDVIVNEESKF